MNESNRILRANAEHYERDGAGDSFEIIIARARVEQNIHPGRAPGLENLI
jgi:hypothetical protein